MRTPADPGKLYEAKALAELRDADALAGVGPGGWRGDAQGAVALVVGPAVSGPDAMAAPLSGVAGEAASKALAALGFEEGTVFVIASRPEGVDPAQAVPRLRLALEAVDAPLVMALDARAADDLAAAFGCVALEPGKPVRASGRLLGSTGEFAGSLTDQRAKARVWAAMRGIAAAVGHTTHVRRP